MKHGVAMSGRMAFRDTAEHVAAVELMRSAELSYGGFPSSSLSDWYRASSRVLLAVVHEFERVALRVHSLPSSSVWFRSALVHSLTHANDMTLLRVSVKEGPRETVLWFVRDGSVVLFGALLVSVKRKLDAFERALTDASPDALEVFRMASEMSYGVRFDICSGAL